MFPNEQFFHCYRLKQFQKAERPQLPNVRRRLLLPPLATFQSDVYHALNQRVDRRPAKRVVSTFHDLFVMTSEYSSPGFRARFTEQARRAARNSDLIVAVSQFTADQVHDLLQFERSRIRVIPHGVHLPFLERRPAREKIVLFVGALQIRKNLIRLVEAFEGLPRDWRLVLAGAPGGYGAIGILNWIERSKCRDRIQVTGYLASPALEHLYWRASIFAFPSLDEGFGLPILEAMAYEIPVVTSNRSALPEVAEGAAILVDPEQTVQIREALLELMQDSGQRAHLIRAGVARAELFTWERTLRATHSVYEELLRS